MGSNKRHTKQNISASVPPSLSLYSFITRREVGREGKSKGKKKETRISLLLLSICCLDFQFWMNCLPLLFFPSLPSFFPSFSQSILLSFLLLLLLLFLTMQLPDYYTSQSGQESVDEGRKEEPTLSSHKLMQV